MSAGPIDDLDQTDMQRLAAGHDAALDSLMERHGERLFQFLVRALQNQAEAADLAEEAFLRVYQNRSRFDPKHKFSTWLFTIATNLVRDRFRWRSRHPEVSIDASPDGSASDWLGQLSDSRLAPDAGLERTERAEAVRRAIAELPEDLKTALLLSEYEELSHAEIAQVLGCSEKAVEMRLYRARQQLRTLLSDLLQRV